MINPKCTYAFATALILLTGATTAFAQSCAKDRTPLEMAGHTLCLPTAEMPTIHRDENGAVNGLTWSKPDKLPTTAQLPPGTFHLKVNIRQFNPPSLEETESSDLPDMRQIQGFRRTFLFPQQARLNGQPFRLECRASINPPQAKQGAQDCEIYAMVAAHLRVEVLFETVVWASGPAWPRLDERWGETWVPYLASLGAGISNLLSIQ